VNTKIVSNLSFINSELKIFENEKYYTLKNYLFSLINFSQIKTIIFSRYHPLILQNNLLELNSIDFIDKNFNRINNILKLNELSLDEISEFLKIKGINLNKKEKNTVHKLVKNNFAVLKFLIDDFKNEKLYEKNLIFENFLNSKTVGLDETNNHFILKYLSKIILKKKLNEQIKNILLRLALYGKLNDRLNRQLNLEEVTEKDINFLYSLLDYDNKNKIYHIHSIIREAIIFMILDKAIKVNDFSIIYNNAKINLELFIGSSEKNSENYLLNKLAVSEIEKKKIKFKKYLFINFFKEDIILFYNEKDFPYLNFYIFFKIIIFYPFMTYDEKNEFIGLLNELENEEIGYWLDLFGIFYSKGKKIWNDLRNNIFKDFENYIDYLQFIFLVGYKNYSKILEQYEKNFKGKKGFGLFKKIIDRNKDRLKESIKNILKNDKISLDEKYKIIGLFVFLDRKTKEKNFKKIMDELKKDKNLKKNIMIKLSYLMEMIKERKISKKEIENFLKSFENKNCAIIHFLKAKKCFLDKDCFCASKEFKDGLKIDFSIFKNIDYIFKDEELKKEITLNFDYKFIKKYSIESVLQYIKFLEKYDKDKAIEVAKYFAEKVLNSEIINKYLDLISKKDIDKAINEAEDFISKVYSINVILKYIELLNKQNKDKAIEVAKYFAEITYHKEIVIKYMKLFEKNRSTYDAINEIECFFNKIDDIDIFMHYLKLLKKLSPTKLKAKTIDESILNHIKKSSKNSNHLNNLSVIFRKLGKFENAIECCEEAIKISNKKNNQAITNCGFAYKSYGDMLKENYGYNNKIEEKYKKAACYFLLAIRKNKKNKKVNPAPYYGLGQLYYNWALLLKKNNVSKLWKLKLQRSKLFLLKSLEYNKNISKLVNLLFLIKVLYELDEDYFYYIKYAYEQLIEIEKSIYIEKWIKKDIEELYKKALDMKCLK
jgi:tetratricopeptide (TPR) repeat protein